MLTLIKRLVVSLFAAGVASVAAFVITYRIVLLNMADSHDGQAAMSPFFGAVFMALAAGMIAVAVVFRLSRKWFSRARSANA